MTYFAKIFGTFSLSFSCEIKLYMKCARQAGIPVETFCIPLTRQKSLRRAIKNLVQ